MATKKDPAQKRIERNAAKRMNYWAGRRLKDIINRRSQLDSWRETIETVYETKAAARTIKPAQRVTAEARAA